MKIPFVETGAFHTREWKYLGSRRCAGVSEPSPRIWFQKATGIQMWEWIYQK